MICRNWQAYRLLNGSPGVYDANMEDMRTIWLGGLRSTTSALSVAAPAIVNSMQRLS
jgi:hypothetical protein